MRTRSISVVVAAVACLAWAASAPATAQSGPLLAELVELRRIRGIIPADSAREFAVLAGATPDQAAAAKSLVEAARLDLSRAVNRHLRMIRDEQPSSERIDASERRVVESAAEVERRMLTDLRSVLDDAQAGGMERFERSHRRALYATFDFLPLPLDLVRYLRAAGVDTGASPELAEVMLRYETEGDRLLIAYARAVKAYREFSREPYDASPEMRERSGRTLGEQTRASEALTRFQSQVLERVLPLIPQDVQDRLVFATLATELSMLGRTLKPANTPVVREALSLNLDAEPRARIEALAAATERRLLDRARRFAGEQAAFERLSPEARQSARSVNDTPKNRFYADITSIQRELNASVLALLTPEQRSAYDALPVRDRSVLAPILDEGEGDEWWR